jgi:hypothetical protein
MIALRPESTARPPDCKVRGHWSLGLGVRPWIQRLAAIAWAIGIRTSVPEPQRKLSSDQGVRPCRLKRPSPKLRRESALRRAKAAFVPPAQYQGLCAKAQKTYASRRRSPSGRRVGYVVTGAAVGTGKRNSPVSEYRHRRAGLAPRPFAIEHDQVMVDRLEEAAIAQPDEPAIDRAPGREIVASGRLRLRAAGARRSPRSALRRWRWRYRASARHAVDRVRAGGARRRTARRSSGIAVRCQIDQRG